MTDQPDNHADPILDALSAADPMAGQPIPTPDLTNLQEILMTAPNANPTAGADRNAFGPPPAKSQSTESPRKRRFAVTGAAAAAVAVAGITAMSFLGPGATPAAAAAIDAAEATADIESGTATITLDIEDGRGTDETANFDLVFDGLDTAVTVEFTGDRALDGSETMALRVVDGVIYGSTDDRTWFSIDDERIGSLLNSTGLSVDMRIELTDAVVELITGASDVTEVESGRFAGTVTTEEVARLAESLPALRMLGGSDLADGLDDADVPTGSFDVEMTLDDEGRIDIFTVTADEGDFAPTVDGSDHDGRVMMTIDFDDLGIEQLIEAPAGATELDLESFGN